jgi:hypothetical protein
LKKNIFIVGFSFFGLLGLQGCDLDIIDEGSEQLPLQKNTVATLECNETKNMRFREENSIINIKGQCDNISISGKNSNFYIESSKSIQLAGQKNKIQVKAPATSVKLAGTNNTMQLSNVKNMAIAGANNTAELNMAESMQVAGFYNNINLNELGTIKIVGILSTVQYQNGIKPATAASVYSEGMFIKVQQTKS